MRSNLGSSDVCNEVMMMRSAVGGAFVLVEGVTDDRVYGKFIAEGVRIVQCHSKDNVRRAVKELTGHRGLKEVIGIVDADLDLLDHICETPPLFRTDCRDMEMLCIRSNALDDVLDEYADRDKLKAFTSKYGPVRDVLVNSSSPIGLLMHISMRQSLDLNFGDLDAGKFIDRKSLRIDKKDLIKEVLSNSGSAKASRSMLMELLQKEEAELEDPWHAARGHDTVSILLLALTTNFGSFNARNLNEGALGGALRLAFSDSDFFDTRLYRDTVRWAEKNGLKLWDINPL